MADLNIFAQAGNGDAGDSTVIERKPEQVEETRTKKPQMYKILLHNDDTTPFQFVEGLLSHYFQINAEKAKAISWTVHTQGLSFIALFRKEIAEAKTQEVNDFCQSQDHPKYGDAPEFPQKIELRFSCEPE